MWQALHETVDPVKRRLSAALHIKPSSSTGHYTPLSRPKRALPQAVHTRKEVHPIWRTPQTLAAILSHLDHADLFNLLVVEANRNTFEAVCRALYRTLPFDRWLIKRQVYGLVPWSRLQLYTCAVAHIDLTGSIPALGQIPGGFPRLLQAFPNLCSVRTSTVFLERDVTVADIDRPQRIRLTIDRAVRYYPAPVGRNSRKTEREAAYRRASMPLLIDTSPTLWRDREVLKREAEGLAFGRSTMAYNSNWTSPRASNYTRRGGPNPFELEYLHHALASNTESLEHQAVNQESFRAFSSDSQLPFAIEVYPKRLVEFEHHLPNSWNVEVQYRLTIVNDSYYDLHKAITSHVSSNPALTFLGLPHWASLRIFEIRLPEPIPAFISEMEVKRTGYGLPCIQHITISPP